MVFLSELRLRMSDADYRALCSDSRRRPGEWGQPSSNGIKNSRHVDKVVTTDFIPHTYIPGNGTWVTLIKHPTLGHE